MIENVVKNLANYESFKRKLIGVPNKLPIYFRFNEENKDLLVSKMIVNFATNERHNFNSNNYLSSGNVLKLANLESIEKIRKFKASYPYDITDLATINKIKSKIEDTVYENIISLNPNIRLDHMNEIESVTYQDLIHIFMGSVRLTNSQVYNSMCIYRKADRYFLVGVGAIIEIKLDKANNCIHSYEPLVLIKIEEEKKKYLERILFIYGNVITAQSRNNIHTALYSNREFTRMMPSTSQVFEKVKNIKLSVLLSNALLDNKNKFLRSKLNESIKNTNSGLVVEPIMKDMKSRYFIDLNLKTATNLRELQTLNLVERESFAEFLDAKFELSNTGKLVLE